MVEGARVAAERDWKWRKEKKNLYEGFGVKLDVCAPREEGTFRRRAQSLRKQMYSI